MKNIYRIAIIAAITIAVILLMNLAGMLSFLNNPLNQMVAGSLDISCKSDSDCVIKKTGCGICDCPDIAVNKDWEVFCPFRQLRVRVMCKMCMGPSVWEVKCADNRCQQYFKIPE